MRMAGVDAGRPTYPSAFAAWLLTAIFATYNVRPGEGRGGHGISVCEWRFVGERADDET
jgi:hypothetical protein